MRAIGASPRKQEKGERQKDRKRRARTPFDLFGSYQRSLIDKTEVTYRVRVKIGPRGGGKDNADSPSLQGTTSTQVGSVPTSDNTERQQSTTAVDGYEKPESIQLGQSASCQGQTQVPTPLSQIPDPTSYYSPYYPSNHSFTPAAVPMAYPPASITHINPQIPTGNYGNNSGGYYPGFHGWDYPNGYYQQEFATMARQDGACHYPSQGTSHLTYNVPAPYNPNYPVEMAANNSSASKHQYSTVDTTCEPSTSHSTNASLAKRKRTSFPGPYGVNEPSSSTVQSGYFTETQSQTKTQDVEGPQTIAEDLSPKKTRAKATNFFSVMKAVPLYTGLRAERRLRNNSSLIRQTPPPPPSSPASDRL